MPTARTVTPAEALLAALSDRPGTSAAALAEAAGIGRSTATKVLAALGAAGKVTRSDGGRQNGRRLPDRWSFPAEATRTRRAAPSDAAIRDGAPRLAKGELAGLVLAHLKANPGEHSPHELAKALGPRSAGAVGNALDRLTERGEAVRSATAPRRYRASGS
jgi:hypothetical protein